MQFAVLHPTGSLCYSILRGTVNVDRGLQGGKPECCCEHHLLRPGMLMLYRSKCCRSKARHARFRIREERLLILDLFDVIDPEALLGRHLRNWVCLDDTNATLYHRALVIEWAHESTSLSVNRIIPDIHRRLHTVELYQGRKLNRIAHHRLCDRTKGQHLCAKLVPRGEGVFAGLYVCHKLFRIFDFHDVIDPIPFLALRLPREHTTQGMHALSSWSPRF
mmetsp:Transcript_10172/g.19528  ORF Transcript_10172/g.19528 Transcript_10172/m.19528 type:complete len:220 (-) Transcript_10172:46-705(-)